MNPSAGPGNMGNIEPMIARRMQIQERMINTISIKE
jgi:GTP cyclohydrolase I